MFPAARTPEETRKREEEEKEDDEQPQAGPEYFPFGTAMTRLT